MSCIPLTVFRPRLHGHHLTPRITSRMNLSLGTHENMIVIHCTQDAVSTSACTLRSHGPRYVVQEKKVLWYSYKSPYYIRFSRFCSTIPHPRAVGLVDCSGNFNLRCCHAMAPGALLVLMPIYSSIYKLYPFRCTVCGRSSFRPATTCGTGACIFETPGSRKACERG